MSDDRTLDPVRGEDDAGEASLRPQTLAEFVGQTHLLGPGKPLRVMAEQGRLRSMLLWGPPGVGKTTLAALLAGSSGARFVRLSAVTAGVKEVRALAAEAASARAGGVSTLLFLDEVHRFNKAQQDLLLPFVEDGTLLFIGATTENPSFEVNGALRSRLQLFVLQALSTEELETLLTQALAHPDGFHGELSVTPEALADLAGWADGDGRRALGALEAAAPYAERLFPLPAFLRDETAPATSKGWLQALVITGHFLARDAFHAHNRPLPDARERLQTRVAGLAEPPATA